MPIKVGINGFGRIGPERPARSPRAKPGGGDRRRQRHWGGGDVRPPSQARHNLRHPPPSVESGDGEIVVGGRGIKFLSTPDPAQLPWRDLGADIVIESTGHYTDSEKARTHIDEGGAKKVIISAPALDHRKVQLLVRVEQRPCLDHAEPGYVLRRLRPLPA